MRILKKASPLLLGSLLLIGVIGLSTIDQTPTRAVGNEAAALPDLAMQLDVSPAQVQVGQPITVTRTIRNQGDAFARDFCSYLYIDPAVDPPQPTTPGQYENCLHTRLDPGMPYAYSRGYTFTSCGQHVIYAWVDPANTVIESDETNNRDRREVIVTGCNHQGEDTHEPDNVCGQAHPVAADGVHYRHTLWPVGDQDWIRIDMTAGVEYIIQTENVGADGDTEIELYDYCQGTLLASNQDSLGPGAQLIWQATASGPYYIQITHTQPNYGPDTHYDLWVQVHGATDRYEPDDTCLTAREIGANGPAQEHLFGLPGDQDWLRFQATAGTTYHVILENIGPDAQPKLSLFGRCGQPPIVERAAGQSLEWLPDTSGLYHLRVRDNDPASYGPGATYRLRLRTAGSTPDPGDDDPVGAQQIATDGTPKSGSIAPSRDQDWFYFDAVAGQNYRIETFDLDPATDTVVCLYAAAGVTRLACDDDSGSGPASRIWWTAPSTGRFYVKVRDYRQDAGGDRTTYRLSVAAGTAACDSDPFEQDNTYYQAHDIPTDGSWQRHNTCPATDLDWARFWAPAGRTYAIETANLGPDADTLLTLYDTDGQTPLWSNDDAGPGRSSQILWTFRREGVYYLKIEPYGPTGAGRGAEYDLRVAPSSVTPTPTSRPTATFTPTPTPTATPSPTPTSPPNARTILVTNSERVTTLYGAAATNDWLAALTRLAGHDLVRGVVLDAAKDNAAAAVYAAWATDLTSVERANQVADAVRNLIMRQLARSPDADYIVLVGDDRVVPYQRVADRPDLTGAYESAYPDVAASSTIGAALKADRSLNDDFYADYTPNTFEGRPVYVPDLAIGRLVETPAEVIGMIDAFMAAPTLTVQRSFVVGYDSQEDGARQTCTTWRNTTMPGLNCERIGGSWGAPEFQTLQLTAAPRFDLQGLFVTAWHYIEGSPAGKCSTNPNACTYAWDIAAAPADLRGVLIWQTGGHGGLNVPPGNPESELDLPQAFARKGANYVANTGSALLGKDEVILAERLMNLFAAELSERPQIAVGEAWLRAKRRYAGITLQGLRPDFSEYDRKVLSVATLYGMPMMQINTVPGALAAPFPSVTITVTGGGALGEVFTRTLDLNLQSAVNALDITGKYYVLDGYSAVSPQTPAQPQFYVPTAGWASGPLVGAVWTGGEYLELPGFQPMRAEVAVDGAEPSVAQRAAAWGQEPARGWSPAFPAITSEVDDDRFTLALGQYDEDTGRERLYSGMRFDLYFGASPDVTPPAITWVAARRDGREARFKVAASDASGVQRVVIAYTYEDLHWRSIDLRFDDATQKWLGALPGQGVITWLVQAVDGVGNVTVDINKDSYYRVWTPRASYLPLVLH